MTYLLDVNVLIAALWITHVNHAKADAWIRGKKIALCPISEMGFLRISSHPRGIGASTADAEKLLKDFWANVRPEFIPDDLSATTIRAGNSNAVTDTYLSALAHRHNMKLATLDSGIRHPAVEIIK